MSSDKESHHGPGPDDPTSRLEEAEVLRDDVHHEAGEGSDSIQRKRTETLAARTREWNVERALRVLGEVADSITANLDFRSLVRQILDTAVQTVGAERGILFLGREDDPALVPAVALSLSGNEINDLERVSRTILRWSRRGESFLTPDAAEDARFSDVPSIQVHQIRSVLCVPMLSREETVGVIYLDAPSTRSAFPDHAQRFMEVLARIAAAAVENARLHGELIRENARLQQRIGAEDALRRVVTLNPEMNGVLRRASLAANVDTPVLIIGERGTGKQLLARTIHQSSPRALHALTVYNCAMAPPDLAEGLLFGRAKEDPSRGLRETSGLVRQADNGVLYLEEVDVLERELQSRLVLLLREGLVRPQGSRRSIRVNVRVIAASTRDPQSAIRSGRIREDLYYLMNPLELRIPPLRERPEDIPILVDHFLGQYAAADERGRPPEFTPEALQILQDLKWRGNVRELENLVQRVLAISSSRRVTVSRLQQFLTEALDKHHSTIEKAPIPESLPLKRLARKDIPVEQLREVIRDALVRTGGNRSRAARLLGIHRNTLRTRMRELGLS